MVVELFDFEKGDLLFSYTERLDETEAIAKLIQGWCGNKINHVGIFDGNGNVIEATHEGVILTPVPDFFAKSHHVFLGRTHLSELCDVAVARAMSLLGAPYNFTYTHTSDGYYCSQLVYECYRYKSGNTFFALDTLRFRDPETDRIIPFFVTYYQELEIAIPEGEPGTHPATLSLHTGLAMEQIT